MNSSILLVLLTLTSCTTGHISDYIQRGEKAFEIRSSGPKREVGEFFFLTSYKLCTERFQQGFNLLHWNVDKSDIVHGLIECKGKPDPFWKDRLDPKFNEIKESKSKVFHGGGRFNFSLDELKNQGIRVR